MAELDFADIAPRLGGQSESFEELCCQVAHRKAPSDSHFFRLHGAGGDGGVECFAVLPSGEEIGWQAKFVFDIDSLIVQLNHSLQTALNIHPVLNKYIVCFPFDLTGPTGRGGKSGKEKFEEWRQAQEHSAVTSGRALSIEEWSASTFRGEILSIDSNGGLRAFFFNATVLSKQWFEDRLNQAIAAAGPRYTPQLNIETPLWKWFVAFGRTKAWVEALRDQLNQLRQVMNRFSDTVGHSLADALPQIFVSSRRNTTYHCQQRILMRLASYSMQFINSENG